MYEKFLPIGTICQLIGTDQKVAITGFCMKNENRPDKIFDYVACYYPQGVYDQNKNILFDHNQIEKVVYLGFINEEEKAFKEKVKAILNKESESQEQPEKQYDATVYNMDEPVASFVSEE